MATSNLGRKTNEINDSLDSIVIVNALGDVPGGRTLDVSGVAEGTTVIAAGHVIVKTADGAYKPLGVTGSAYAEIGATDSAVGILKASVLVSDPRAAIVTIGQVNAAAAAKAVGAPYTDDIKEALPQIQFI